MPPTPRPNRPTEGIFDEGGIFGQFAQAAQQQAGVYGEAGRFLLGWVQRFLTSSVPRVAAVMLEGEDCSVDKVGEDGSMSPCDRRAVFRCSFCKHAACEGHAFSGVDGSGVCVACCRLISEAGGRPRPAPRAPRPARPAPRSPQAEHQDALRAAFAVLGVKPGADWGTVRAAYKKLVATWHPDQYRGPESPEVVEAKIRAINDAYTLLTKEREKART